MPRVKGNLPGWDSSIARIIAERSSEGHQRADLRADLRVEEACREEGPRDQDHQNAAPRNPGAAPPLGDRALGDLELLPPHEFGPLAAIDALGAAGERPSAGNAVHGSILADHEQRLPFFNRLAGLDVDRLHRPVARGGDLVLELHGVEAEHRLILLHRVARLQQDLRDQARDRRAHLGGGGRRLALADDLGQHLRFRIADHHLVLDALDVERVDAVAPVPAEVEAPVSQEGGADRPLLVVERHDHLLPVARDDEAVAVGLDVQLEVVAVRVGEEFHRSSRNAIFHGEIGRGLAYFGVICSRRRNSRAAARIAASSWWSAFTFLKSNSWSTKWVWIRPARNFRFWKSWIWNGIVVCTPTILNSRSARSIRSTAVSRSSAQVISLATSES